MCWGILGMMKKKIVVLFAIRLWDIVENQVQMEKNKLLGLILHGKFSEIF